MRAVPLVFPLLLALSLPAWAQVQSKDQQKCIKTLNKAYDGVAKAQRSTINRCINLGSKGKLPTTINACVLADDKGRVLRAQQKTLAKEAVACGAAPDFGATSGANVNAEAVAGELSALSGLLGSDLDAPFDPADKASARCQRKVVKAAGKCSALLVKDYAQCAVRSLAGKDGEPAADEFGLVRCKGSDRKGIVAKVCDVKLAAAIAKGCAGQDLDTLFPGCEGQDLATCARGHAQAGPNGGLNASAGICEPDPSLPVPAPDRAHEHRRRPPAVGCHDSL